MMNDRLLLGSGPSNPPPAVLEALARPLCGMFDPAFVTILEETSQRLREVFRTSNRMTFAVSGTGSAGLEAALVNVLEPGDLAVIGVNGVFGNRMVDVVNRAGATAAAITAEWSEPIDVDDVRAALSAHPDAKVFALVHAETSTGVAQPMEDIAAVVREHGALFVLDTVTSLSGMDVEVDAWGIDVAYSGTQKCLSVPPGLAPITFSQRALDVVRARRRPVQSWYLDVTLLEAYWGPSDGARVYHHTPPISMVTALHAGLQLILDEGLEARWARHADASERLATGLLERGFSYVASEGLRLPMLHCVRLPGERDEAALRKRLLDEHSIEISAGLGPFKGVCWRIGLMGYNATRANVDRLLQAIDDVL